MSLSKQFRCVLRDFEAPYIDWLDKVRGLNSVNLDEQHFESLLRHDLLLYSQNEVVSSLRELVESKIISRLEKPCVAVADDVIKYLRDHTAGVSTADRDLLSKEMCRVAELCLVEGETDIGIYSAWSERPCGLEDLREESDRTVFFRIGETFSLQYQYVREEVLLENGPPDPIDRLKVLLVGGTQSANSSFAKKLQSAVDVMLEGFRLIAIQKPPEEPTEGVNSFKDKLALQMAQIGANVPQVEDVLTTQDNKSALKYCLSAWLNDLPKNRVENRIERAMRLLTHADTSREDGVAISLCFSAIEALLCEGKDSLVQQVARRTSTLLEPNGHARPDGIKLIKKYYDKRSKFMHGEQIEVSREQRLFVRRLAAATIISITCWLEHERRVMGENANNLGKKDEFLKELRRTEEGGQEFVGIGETFSHCLQEYSNLK